MTVIVTPEPRKPEPETTNLHRATVFYDVANLRFTPNERVELPSDGLQFLVDNGQAVKTLSRAAPTAAGGNASPDLMKKIDELTAQVQALTKTIKGLKVGQGEKK